MSKTDIARVHYFERQFLRTKDFTDEQAYHLEMRRRHNIAQHSWGIVQGLEIAADPEGNPFIYPGMAIDGYGRELILLERQAISTIAFDDKDSDVLDVWLEYDLVGTELPASGYTDCGADSSQSPYRLVEKPLLRLAVPDPARTNRREPKGVPIGDLAFKPSRVPPDDPLLDWPVFLGQVERTKPKPDKPYIYSFDLSAKPYAGLVGESVSAPSGKAQVQIGAEKKDDPRRFAVFIPEVHPEDDKPQLSIDNTGEMEIRGKTKLHGDLSMKGGAVEFIVGSAVSPPESASPWRVYRAKKIEGVEGSHTIETNELRIEMDAPGTEGNNQIVIGSWSEEEKKFSPCLTIQDNGQVTVHGNLIVTGTVTGPITKMQQKAKRKLSDVAQMSALSMFQSGIAGTNVLLASPLRGMIKEAPAFYAHALMSSKEGMKAIVEGIGGGSDPILDAFVKDVKAHPVLLKKLKEKLP